MVEAYVAYPSKPKNVTGPIRYFRFDVFLGETMSSDGDPFSSFADTLPLLFIFRNEYRRCCNTLNRTKQKNVHVIEIIFMLS